MLRAAEVGEDGKRIGEVVERVEVVERTEREGEVEGEEEAGGGGCGWEWGNGVKKACTVCGI